MPISPWLERALSMAEKRRKTPTGLRLIVEVEPSKVDSFITEIKRMGFKYIDRVENYVTIDVKEPADVYKVNKIPGVVYISYEKKFFPMALGLDELVKRINVMTDPLLNKLSRPDLERLGYSFKATVQIPTPMDVIVQDVSMLSDIVSNPLAIRKYVRWNFPWGAPVLSRAEWELVTYTRTLMDAPDDNKISNTLVGVIDTGPRYGPGIGYPPNVVTYVLTLLPEPPIDQMSHGSWCHACAFGRRAITRYGMFVPVAEAPKVFHYKVFGAFGGATETQIMKAMEKAAKGGVKVVSMSLGGPLTEPIERDPTSALLSKLHEKYGTIFVVAAGNEGPEEWTIASPGTSPDAITVAAVDWKTMDVSSYSSRGPQGAYYKEHKDEFDNTLSSIGDDFLKPDVAGIGGDVKTQIVSACSPWYDGMYDFIPDGWDEMVGTSMATPHVAGLVALLYDRGVIRTVKDIKRTMASIANNKTKELGYGLFKYSYFTSR